MNEASSLLVSIIIPCYRQGKFLATAIDSALGQTYPTVEVLVVNDGSDDDSETVARGYGERIRYFYKVNGGPSSARNVGIDNARGKYVLFLDGDDSLHAQAVGWLMTAMHGAPDGVAIMGFSDFTEDPLRDAGPAILPLPHPSFLASLLERNFAIHCHLVARDLVIKAGNFDSRMRYCEDWDLWARVAALGPPFMTCSSVGAFYRRTPRSLSTVACSMVGAATQVVLRMSTMVCAKSSQVHELGPALLRLLYATRRRVRAWSHACAQEQRLTEAIRHLRRIGVRVRKPLLVNLQDHLPEAMGDWVEKLGLWALCRFHPALYHDIRYFR